MCTTVKVVSKAIAVLLWLPPAVAGVPCQLSPSDRVSLSNAEGKYDDAKLEALDPTSNEAQAICQARAFVNGQSQIPYSKAPPRIWLYITSTELSNLVDQMSKCSPLNDPLCR